MQSETFLKKQIYNNPKKQTAFYKSPASSGAASNAIMVSTYLQFQLISTIIAAGDADVPSVGHVPGCHWKTDMEVEVTWKYDSNWGARQQRNNWSKNMEAAKQEKNL